MGDTYIYKRVTKAKARENHKKLMKTVSDMKPSSNCYWGNRGRCGMRFPRTSIVIK